MSKIKHEVYKDYPEQPYISPERDVEGWGNAPEDFPYGVVEKKQMIRVEEGLLPGDIVMLWRIHFDNFTNETVIPQYFEYRYGVNSDASIELLKKVGYIEQVNATASLSLLNVGDVKKILTANNLPVSGKKGDLLSRVVENINEDTLAKLFTLRKYQITELGSKVLAKYDNIIQKHGPKM